MTNGQPMIELRRLYRFFGETKANNDVSFSVARGEVFGFIGPNGAGKTTSMRILATLDLPTYGDAFVDGFSVINDPDRVRRRLGFMPDYFGTYANVNCAEYLDFFARAYGLTGADRRDAISKTMRFTGLDSLAEKPTRGLSKGMRQRLCLGRSMIHDPAVLVLDEPAAGLDPRARIELREMIRQLAAQGKAILVSSHILTELAEMCDRVGIIEQGQLLVTGTVEEIQNQQTPRSEVHLRILGPNEPCRVWLERRAGVQNLVVEGSAMRFSHMGSEQAQVDLLRELVAAGFSVVEFGARSLSLEDVFMQVTRGAVQ